MICSFNAAKNHSSENQLEGQFLLGDFNARFTAWGDTTSNGNGKLCGSVGFGCHLPTNSHLLKSMPLVEVFLTCACATLQCASYTLMPLRIRK